MIVHDHGVEWYAAKLERGEPFSLLTYGDGEFMVASGRHVGRELTNYREVVTEQLRDEMRASFAASDGVVVLSDPAIKPPDRTPEGYVGYIQHNEILRGSDPNILDPNQYQGRDRAAMWACHAQAKEWIERVPEWVDGTVWDVAAREGRLGPLLWALKKRRVILVASEAVLRAKVPVWNDYAAVRGENAAASIEMVETSVNAIGHHGPDTVVVVCCGLSAIPLIMRLRRRCPGATYLDLGSTFDVFARTGGERGWRAELYADQARWEECVRKNLEGA